MRQIVIISLLSIILAVSACCAYAAGGDPSECVGLIWAFGETSNWATSGAVVGDGQWVISSTDAVGQSVGAKTINARNIVFISPYTGKSYPCEIKYTNAEMNLCLLRIQGPGLPAITLAKRDDFAKAQFGTLGQIMSTDKVGSNWPAQVYGVFGKGSKKGTVMSVGLWNAKRAFVLELGKYNTLMLSDFDQEAPLPSGAIVFRSNKAVGMYVQKLTLTGEHVTLSYGQCAASFEIADVLQGSGPSQDSLFSPPGSTITKPTNAAKLFELQTKVYAALAVEMGSDEIDSAQALVDADPNDAQAHVLLALTMADKGKLEDAIKQYDLAIAIQPGLRTAKARKAMLLYDMGSKDDAITQLLAINKEAPRDVNAINSLITIYSADNKTLDNALAFAKKGADLNPTPGQLLRLVDLQKRKKDWQGAVDTIGKLLKAFPDFPEAYAQLGSVFELGGDKVKAEAAYRKWLDVDKSNPDAYFTLTVFLADNDRKPEAKTVLAKLRELKPGKDVLDAAQSLEDRIDGKTPPSTPAPEVKPEAKPDGPASTPATGSGTSQAAPTQQPTSSAPASAAMVPDKPTAAATAPTPDPAQCAT